MTMNDELKVVETFKKIVKEVFNGKVTVDELRKWCWINYEDERVIEVRRNYTRGSWEIYAFTDRLTKFLSKHKLVTKIKNRNWIIL